MKKQRTFEQRWNATALRRIRKQYLAGNSDFLCCNSKEFAALWSDYKHKIKELAAACTFPNCIINPDSGDYLFYSAENLPRSAWRAIRKKVRIDFLTNEIKRLTKKR